MPYRSAIAKRIEQDRREAAEAIASAVGFATHFRKGPFETYTIESANLADARAVAERLNAEHGRYGRRAVVYALSVGGGQTPISPSF
jgi:hypothetical protein